MVMIGIVGLRCRSRLATAGAFEGEIAIAATPLVKRSSKNGLSRPFTTMARVLSSARLGPASSASVHASAVRFIILRMEFLPLLPLLKWPRPNLERLVVVFLY